MNQITTREVILLYALDYALGRNTAAVDDVIGEIKRLWYVLSRESMEYIRKAIHRHLDLNPNCSAAVQWTDLVERIELFYFFGGHSISKPVDITKGAADVAEQRTDTASAGAAREERKEQP